MGVSAERHWRGRGAGGVESALPHIISETKCCSERGEGRSKSLVETHQCMLNILRLKSRVMSRRRSKQSVSHFSPSSRLGGLQRAETQSKCWYMSHNGTAWNGTVLHNGTHNCHTWKCQDQRQVTKGDKIKAKTMPCNTRFLSHFARRYR